MSKLKVLLMLVVLLGLAHSALADPCDLPGEYYWKGGTGNWSDVNWNLDQVAVSGDTMSGQKVHIGNSDYGDADITFTYGYQGGGVGPYMGFTYIGQNGESGATTPTTNVLRKNNSEWFNANYVYLGKDAGHTGTIYMSDGSFTTGSGTSASIYVGGNGTASAVYQSGGKMSNYITAIESSAAGVVSLYEASGDAEINSRMYRVGTAGQANSGTLRLVGPDVDAYTNWYSLDLRDGGTMEYVYAAGASTTGISTFRVSIDTARDSQANLAGNLSLVLDAVPGTEELVLIDGDEDAVFGLPIATVGTFAGLAEGALVTADYGGTTYYWTISYVGGALGNDVVLTNVPEPATIMLLIGGAGFLLRRRRA